MEEDGKATKLTIEEMKMKDIGGEPATFEWTFDEANFKDTFSKARLNTAPGFSGLNMHVLRAITTNKELRTIYANVYQVNIMVVLLGSKSGANDEKAPTLITFQIICLAVL